MTLSIPAILGAICAVLSLFPWFETPLWIAMSEERLAAVGGGKGVGSSYAPWGLAGIGDAIDHYMRDMELGSAILIVITVLWVAALIVLVLGVVDAFAPGALSMIPVRNLLVIGAVGMVAVAIVALCYVSIVNSQMVQVIEATDGVFQTELSIRFMGIADEEMARISDSTHSGFGFSIWLWATLGFGVATIVTSVLASRTRR